MDFILFDVYSHVIRGQNEDMIRYPLLLTLTLIPMFNELIQLDITISLFFRNLIVSGDTLAPWVMVLSDFEVLLT